MKFIITTIILNLAVTRTFSQIDNALLKTTLTKNLIDFENYIMTKDDLKYIKTWYFHEILNSLEPKLIPVLFQNDTTADIYIQMNFNAVDTSLSFHYSKKDGEQLEHYFKNCYPKSSKINSESNLISTCSPAHDLISVDTLFNVIITKPSSRKCEVYRSNCPYGTSKDQAKKMLMQDILGQYQLIIYSNKNSTEAYFVAPPNPTNMFRIKHIVGHF